MRSFLPLFSFSFLGLAAVRVWLQCCVYDLYAATDSGMATVAVNMARGAFTLVLMAVVARRGFSPRAQANLGVASAVAMTAAGALLLVSTETGGVDLGWAACLLAALGVVWGGGMWIAFYERLEADEALLCTFASLGLSCLAGLVLGFLPKAITMLVATFMPAAALVAFRTAMLRLDERDALIPHLGTNRSGLPCDRNALAHARGAGKPAPLPYNREPRSTFARLLGGVALFSLALGFARGFPYGQAIELSAPLRCAHQLGTCLLCLLVIWWALVLGRRMRLSLLWNIPLALLVLGVLLLASLDPGLMQVGSALVTIANTFTLGVLWYASYDVSRNISLPCYLVLGAVWVAHQVPREAGRLVAMGVGPYDSSPMLLAACMVILLAGSMFLLVNDSIPRTRPLFADLGRERGAACDQPGEAQAATATTCVPSNPSAPMHGESPLGSSPDPGSELEMRLLLMGQRYQLTRRELDIARLLVDGRSKAQVAEALCLSESTVRTHARNLYAKLDVHSREQLQALVEAFG